MFKRICVLFALFLSFSTASYAVTWTTAETIPQSSPSSEATINVYTVSNELTNQVFAAWSDAGTEFPMYSIYNENTGWTTPLPITQLSTAFAPDVFLAYNSDTGEVWAAWQDGITSEPTYSIYSPLTTTWSAPSTIPRSAPNDFFVAFNVTLSYNPFLKEIVAVYAESRQNYPSYAVYNTLTNTWTTSARTFTSDYPINIDTTDLRVRHNIYLTVDGTGRMIATWSTLGGRPVYSIYDGVTWTQTANPDVYITSSVFSNSDVYVIYNQTTGEVFASWSDDVNLNPYFATFSGTTWSAAQTISTSQQAFSSVFLSATDNGQVFATWADAVSPFEPFYSVFTPGLGWDTASQIAPGFSANADVFVTWASGLRLILATWAKYPGTNYPMWAATSIAPLNPNPPTSLQGIQQANCFLTQIELINVLTWRPPTSGMSPVTYKIYRDAGLTDLVATVPASNKLEFKDHNRVAYRIYTYYIVAIGSNGGASEPAIISVNPIKPEC